MSSAIAGRASCDITSDSGCQLANNHTFQTVQVIYIIVATAIFLIGSAVSVFLIMRQRRKWREQQQQTGKLAEPSNVPAYSYDPSVGRPVQNVWPGDAPPPTYSQV